MRITENMASSEFLRQVRQTNADTFKLTNRIVTGKKVQKASDDVIAFPRGKAMEELIRRGEQFQKNTQFGLFQTEFAQEALQGITDRLVSAKTTAIAATNSSLGINERTGLANEISTIKKDIINLANTSVNDMFLFGGTATNTRPFVEVATATGGVATSSTDKPLKVLAADGVEVETSVTGMEFRATPAGDLFAILNDLEQALSSNDIPAINAMIDRLDAAGDHVTDLAVRVGNSANMLQSNMERLQLKEINQKGQLSTLTDADLVETIAELQQAQSAMEAAFSVQARLLQTGLINFL